MNISISLFESIMILVMTGVAVVAWWGIRRLVKMSDDGVVVLDNLNKSLSHICERLGRSDTWMELHTKQDDERHNELKKSFSNIRRL